MAKTSRLAHAPGGLRPVQDHHDLSKEGIAHLDSDGRIFKMVGGLLVEIEDDGEPITDAPPSDGPAVTEPGWVSYAKWSPGVDVTRLEATWQVPEAPATARAQILFLHVGIQGTSSGKTVFAPIVLQWGRTPFGGGAHWSIACWLQVGEKIMVGNYLDVEVGDQIRGQIAHSEAGHREIWKMKASNGNGEASLAFTLDSTLKATLAYGGVLEAYAFNVQCDQYPASPSITFGALELESGGGVLVPVWQRCNEVTDCGQRTHVIDPANVEILFRSPS